MKKYLNIFIVLLFLLGIFPGYFQLLNQSIASIIEDKSSDGEKEEEEEEFYSEEEEDKFEKKIVEKKTRKKLNVSVTKRKYPPFFRLILGPAEEKKEEEEEQIVYVLGSLHTVPININLSQNSISELIRINSEGARFFTEHEITNRFAFEKLKKIHKQEFTWWSGGRMKNTHLYTDLMNEKIGDYTFEELTKLNVPWLIRIILATHVNSIYYKLLGGMEVELSEMKWLSHDYLEKPDVVLKQLESQDLISFREEKYFMFLLSVIKKYLDSWKLIKDINSSNKYIVREFLDSLKEYQWSAINDNRIHIPKTTITRNESWVEEVLGHLSNSKDNFLIVVGDGHLSKPGVNFLSLLASSLIKRVKKIERFIPSSGVKGKWVLVDIK